jgi:hypothetical protein
MNIQSQSRLRYEFEDCSDLPVQHPMIHSFTCLGGIRVSPIGASVSRSDGVAGWGDSKHAQILQENFESFLVALMNPTTVENPAV